MRIQVLTKNPNWLTIIFALTSILFGVSAGLLVNAIPDVTLLVVTIIGVIAFVVSIARLEWGLIFLVFITYTRFSDIAITYHGAPSIARSFTFVLLLGIIAKWLVYGERPEGWLQSTVLLVAYGAVGVASVLYASDVDSTLDALNDYYKNALIVIIVTIILNRISLFRHVIWALLGAGILLGTLSVIQYITGTFLNNYWGFAQTNIMHIVGETSGRRSAGPLGDPNFFGQILIVLVPLALNRLIAEKRWGGRIIALWALVVSLSTVVLTFSRGAFIALAATFALMFTLQLPRRKAFFANLVIILLLVLFVPNEYSERIFTLSDLTITHPGDASFRGRLSEFLVGWMQFRDNPILGVGLNNYQVHYQEYSRQLGLAPTAVKRSAHNLYIEIAAETGLIGVLTFGVLLWILGRGIRDSWRYYNELGLKEHADMILSYAAGLFGYFTAALFVHDAYPRYLWLLVGIGLSLANIMKRESRQYNLTLQG